MNGNTGLYLVLEHSEQQLGECRRAQERQIKKKKGQLEGYGMNLTGGDWHVKSVKGDIEK